MEIIMAWETHKDSIKAELVIIKGKVVVLIIIKTKTTTIRINTTITTKFPTITASPTKAIVISLKVIREQGVGIKE